jgi:hypothetical protein
MLRVGIIRNINATELLFINVVVLNWTLMTVNSAVEQPVTL